MKTAITILIIVSALCSAFGEKASTNRVADAKARGEAALINP